MSASIQQYFQPKPQQQAVIVYAKLADHDMGDEADDLLYELEEDLQDAIEKTGAGEFDGDEWGNGYCTMFLYGADCNRIFDAVIPLLLAKDFRQGTFLIKRYGGPGSEEQIVRL